MEYGGNDISNLTTSGLMRCHSHSAYAACLCRAVALCIQSAIQPLVSKLPTSVLRPVCAPLVGTRNFQFNAVPFAFRIRCMLMSRCRAMHSVRNTAFGEQAPHVCITSCLRTACRNAQIKIFILEKVTFVFNTMSPFHHRHFTSVIHFW